MLRLKLEADLQAFAHVIAQVLKYFLTQAVQVMTKICAESERSLDYYGLFKQIMKRAPVPMSPLESLASSAVRTAHKVPLLCPVLLTILHLQSELA